jgi:hypothetical protein
MTHRAIGVSLACFVFGSAIALLAAPPDPCALLTPAQASAALGGTVAAGKSLASKSCRWHQEGKAGAELLLLDVTLLPPDRFAHTKSVTIGTVTNVGGLGDDAFYSTLKTGRTTVTTLNIKKGDTAVVIRVSGGEKPVEEYQAKEKAVAQAILPKL